MRYLHPWILGLLLLAATLGGAESAREVSSKSGAAADAANRKEIEFAISSIKSWWALHKSGFEKTRLLMPKGEWKKLDSSRFFTDPKSKGVAYAGLNSGETGNWWASREGGNRGPWKISAPQEDGFTFMWIIRGEPNGSPADICEVRLVYPLAIEM